METYVLVANKYVGRVFKRKLFWFAELVVTGFFGAIPGEDTGLLLRGLSGAAGGAALFGVVWLAMLARAWLVPRLEKRRAYRALWQMPSKKYGEQVRDVASRAHKIDSTEIDYRWVVNALCNRGGVTPDQIEAEAFTQFDVTGERERSVLSGAIGNVFNVINLYELARAEGMNPRGKRVLSSEGAELLTWWRLARVQREHGDASWWC